MNRNTTSRLAVCCVRILSATTIILLVAIIGYIAFRGLWKRERYVSDVLPSFSAGQQFVLSSPRESGLEHLSWFALREMAMGKVPNLRSVTGVNEPFSLYVMDDSLPAFLAAMDLTQTQLVRRTTLPLRPENGSLVVSLEAVPHERNVRLEDKVLAVDTVVAALNGNRRISLVANEDLKRLLAGNLRSWKELGGPDLPVVEAADERELQTVRGSWMVMDAKRWRQLSGSDNAPAKLDVEGLQESRNLSWGYLTGRTVESGKYGGIGTIVVNTFFLVLFTMLAAMPVGVAAALWLVEYAKDGLPKRCIQSGIDILSALPSIIFGLFGLLVFVQLCHWSFSLLSGTLTVSLMVLPTIIRTSEEAMREVNPNLLEASLALGATKMETIFRVVLPASRRGIVTGMILAIGRTVGETAALIYTIGSGTDVPKSLTSSCRVLAMHIYLTITEGQSTDKAFASALVLVLLVLVINSAANRLIHQRRH